MQGDLVLALRIEDVGGGEAHLIADHRAAELDGGEDEASGEADHQPQKRLLGHQQAKAEGGEVGLRQQRLDHRKQQQGKGQRQGSAHPHRHLGAAEDRQTCRSSSRRGRRR